MSHPGGTAETRPRIFDEQAHVLLAKITDWYECGEVSAFKITARTKDGNTIELTTPGWTPARKAHR